MRRRSIAVASAAAAIVAGTGTLASAGSRQEESIAIDRWLVSALLPADSIVDPLSVDLLAGPGEAGILPDRGSSSGGVLWSLVRHDSTATFHVDSVLPDRDSQAVAYAHAYVRLPEDLTLVLAWSIVGCGRGEVWLNGRRISSLGPREGVEERGEHVERRQPRVRLGRGWNTLLLKVAGGECPVGWAAEIRGAPGELEGIRVQASRPPGDVRTGPRPWVLFAPDAGPARRLRWEGDELWGTIVLRLSGWAPAPFDSVDLRMRVGGARAGATARWLEPGTEDSVLVPIPFERILRAIREPPAVRIEARWEKEKVERALGLSAPALLEALHAPIRLDRRGRTGVEEEPALPGAAGDTTAGEWTVPGSLDGFDLVLDVDGAPGAYSVDGEARDPEDGIVPLCRDCRKGRRIRIAAVTTGPWVRFPSARVLDPGYPEALGRPDAPAPSEWIRALDARGGRGYREMGRRWALPGTAMAPVCEPPQLAGILPPALEEASGIVRDPRDPDLFWLHNDSGNQPLLFAARGDGRLVARHRLGGVAFLDPEDLALARCGEAWCLYLADIGDNQAIRPFVEIDRLPLPPLPTGSGVEGDTIRADATWRVVYPDGPRDAEALVVDAERGEILIVSKGREAIVSVYAVGLEELERGGPSGPVTLHRVGRLPVPIGASTTQFITAADLSPDGGRLAVRSYATLFLLPWSGSASFDSLTSPAGPSLVGAGEPQGEGVAFDVEGKALYLASEGRDGRPPRLTRIRCPAR